MIPTKVLVLDIETSPLIAYVWGTHEQEVRLSQIKDDWYIIAWCAKWLGQPASKAIYRDQRHAKKVSDDRAILGRLWELLNEADIVITQNGARFDGPKLNARFIMHGWPPPKPYKHLDTYQIVRRVARFTSNKLEYLADKLCTKYKKLKHSKFPGMSLWTECLAGNVKAWDEMKRYNIHDVLSTEELYMKIRSWAPESLPSPFFTTVPAEECRTCGVIGKLRKRGITRTKVTEYQRYQCRNCGSWQGEKI